jgi:hypothetical protein
MSGGPTHHVRFIEDAGIGEEASPVKKTLFQELAEQAVEIVEGTKCLVCDRPRREFHDCAEGRTVRDLTTRAAGLRACALLYNDTRANAKGQDSDQRAILALAATRLHQAASHADYLANELRLRDVGSKARRYTSSGRLTIWRVDGPVVYARCRGGRGNIYNLRYTPESGWSCSCPARCDDCAHVRAAMIVTKAGLRDEVPAS